MSTRPNAAVATTSSKLFLVVAFAVGYAVGVHSVSDTGRALNLSQRKLLQSYVAAYRISGGVEAAEGRFPYLFSLRSVTGGHKCGAILIHPWFCVTSAHCVDPRVRGSVRLNGVLAIGAHDSKADDRTPGVEVIKVHRTYIHPNFDPESLYDGYDIALLQLPAASTIVPVSLPDPNYLPSTGDFVLALGWGLGASSSTQQQAFLQVQSSAKCRDHWEKRNVSPEKFGSLFMCASNTEADTCKGDSGGPLIIPHVRESNVTAGRPDLDTLVAIVSFGDPNCKNYEVPGVYTLIAPFVEWIEEVTKNLKVIDPVMVQMDGTCTLRKYQTKGNLTLTPEKFNADLIKADIPPTCGDQVFVGFKECAEDLGKEDGCCAKECAEFLASVKGACWKDIENFACQKESNQSAIMLDLLVRRCDERKPSIWCTEHCEDNAKDPISLSISSFNFTLELGRLEVPASCGDFQFEDLGDCSEELGIRTGCCSDDCSTALQKINDECWSDLENSVCSLGFDRVPAILDLLSQRCNDQRRQILCPQRCGYGYICDASSESLLDAAKTGNIETITELLSDGVSPRIIDADVFDQTALYWAAKQGHISIVNALIEAGAKIDARSSDGWTPLITAANNNHFEVVATLLEAGANVDGTSNIGYSALMAASDKGYLKIVVFLVKSGASINEKTNSGRTALSYAANSSIVKFLLSSGGKKG